MPDHAVTFIRRYPGLIRLKLAVGIGPLEDYLSNPKHGSCRGYCYWLLFVALDSHHAVSTDTIILGDGPPIYDRRL